MEFEYIRHNLKGSYPAIFSLAVPEDRLVVGSLHEELMGKSDGLWASKGETELSSPDPLVPCSARVLPFSLSSTNRDPGTTEPAILDKQQALQRVTKTGTRGVTSSVSLCGELKGASAWVI